MAQMDLGPYRPVTAESVNQALSRHRQQSLYLAATLTAGALMVVTMAGLFMALIA
jgi:hypothetical protein